MGEHLPCKQGVKGSNPFISTVIMKRASEPDAKNFYAVLAQSIKGFEQTVRIFEEYP